MFIDVTSIERTVRKVGPIVSHGVAATVDIRQPHADGTAYADDGFESPFTIPLTEDEASQLLAIVESVRARMAKHFT